MEDTSPPPTVIDAAGEKAAITTLHQDLFSYWNASNAAEYADLFTDDGICVGFDGSLMESKAAIAKDLAAIFENHQVATYIGSVRSVVLLSAEVALLQATAGMIPAGGHDIDPTKNAVQSLVAVKQLDGKWKIALFQNTPLRLDGRPDAAAAVTEQLRTQVASLNDSTLVP